MSATAKINPYISDLFFNTQHADVNDVVQLDAEAKQFLNAFHAYVAESFHATSYTSGITPVALVQDFQARL